MNRNTVTAHTQKHHDRIKDNAKRALDQIADHVQRQPQLGAVRERLTTALGMFSDATAGLAAAGAKLDVAEQFADVCTLQLSAAVIGALSATPERQSPQDAMRLDEPTLLAVAQRVSATQVQSGDDVITGFATIVQPALTRTQAAYDAREAATAAYAVADSQVTASLFRLRSAVEAARADLAGLGIRPVLRVQRKKKDTSPSLTVMPQPEAKVA